MVGFVAFLGHRTPVRPILVARSAILANRDILATLTPPHMQLAAELVHKLPMHLALSMKQAGG